MRILINFLISKLKNDPDYRVSSDLRSTDLIVIILWKGFCFLNGVLRQFLLFRYPRVWFVSKGVKINSSSRLVSHGTLILGRNVTLDALGKRGIILGKNVTIPDGCIFRCTGILSEMGEGLIVGDNTGFGHYNFINAQGGVEIGSDVIIGPFVKILSENHNFSNRLEKIRLQGVRRQGVVVESNVWIGADVTILDGVTVGEGAVIGAGSVVTKSIPKFSVAVGSPCKVIKYRH